MFYLFFSFLEEVWLLYFDLFCGLSRLTSCLCPYCCFFLLRGKLKGKLYGLLITLFMYAGTGTHRLGILQKRNWLSIGWYVQASLWWFVLSCAFCFYSILSLPPVCCCYYYYYIFVNIYKQFPWIDTWPLLLQIQGCMLHVDCRSPAWMLETTFNPFCGTEAGNWKKKNNIIDCSIMWWHFDCSW